MRITILLLTAAVLLSLVMNADAATRFDELQLMQQTGPVAMPTQVSDESVYVCYWRILPDDPITLSVEASATHVRRFVTDEPILNRLLEGSRSPLLPTRLPFVNGPVLGGRSTARNLLSSIERKGLGREYFFGLSVHVPSGRRMATILKIRPEERLESACQMAETIEYLCIANEPES